MKLLTRWLRAPHVSTRLMHADSLQRKSCCTAEIFQHNVYNSNDFTTRTVSETCVQCVHHSDPRHTADDV